MQCLMALDKLKQEKIQKQYSKAKPK